MRKHFAPLALLALCSLTGGSCVPEASVRKLACDDAGCRALCDGEACETGYVSFDGKPELRALFVASSSIYVGETREGSPIWRLSKQGGAPEPLLLARGSCQRIAVDEARGLLVWMVSGSTPRDFGPALYRATLGEEGSTLLQAANVTDDLLLEGDTLVWTSAPDPHWGVYSLSLGSGTSELVPQSASTSPTGALARSPSGALVFALPRVWNVEVLSASGRRTLFDGHRPADAPPGPEQIIADQEFAYFALGNTLFRVDLRGRAPAEPIAKAQGDIGPMLLDDQTLYWVDQGARRLMRSGTDGSDPAYVVDDLGKFTAALGHDADAIYWLARDEHRLGRVKKPR